MKIGLSAEAVTGLLLDAQRPKASLQGLISSVVEVAREFDLQVVQLPLDALFLYPALLSREALMRIQQLIGENHLGVIVHLPYMWLDLASLNEGVRKASLRAVLQAWARVELLNPWACSLHLLGEQSKAYAIPGTQEREAFYQRILAQAEHSLVSIVKKVEPSRLCVENLEGIPFEPLVVMAERHGLSLCLDVGHLMMQGEDPIKFIEEHLPVIKVIHLHDVIRRKGARGETTLVDHQPLGNGLLPLPRIVETLQAKGYEGVLLVEVKQRDHLLSSLERLRVLLPSRFALH